MQTIPYSLHGKKGLIIGIANADSIAYGCAKQCRQLGASLALTYLNEKSLPYVLPLARELEADIMEPLDVTVEGQLEHLFRTIAQRWEQIDFVMHSIAFAPKEDLQGRLTDCSQSGFLQAMQISCHTLIQVAKHAEPLMQGGGSLLTMTYHGADKVVDHYNVMGPVKAALESSVRYLAAELGSKNIRVNAISPGPLKTRAASGISHFDELMKYATEKSPGHRLVSTDEVGHLAAFLVGNQSTCITGETLYIDAGLHHMA